MLQRHPSNPLISPSDVSPSLPGWEVIGTFNAGACAFGDQIFLLLRVAERPPNADADVILCPHVVDGEMVVDRVRRDDPAWDTSDSRVLVNQQTDDIRLTSISHLRLARSDDGVHFQVDSAPWLRSVGDYEDFGIEDARITPIDGRYVVNYTAVSAFGIATGLASTADFVDVQRHGIIFPPPNRDVTIFPNRMNEQYVAYHRPMPTFGGLRIWMATSPDLTSWGNHQVVLSANNEDWTSGRIGGGAPPILTDAGWLSIFHAADRQNRYCLGAFISAKDDPSEILALSDQPIFVPEADYETNGFFGKVVFTCGAVQRGDQLLVYYGAADEHVALATVNLNAFLVRLMQP